jgi:3,4-dihydroxy 2-butanone 4-phosphate synthase / GTP cyclohydrolase II
VMNDNGSMARRPDLEKFADQHGLKIGTIADLIHYRVVTEATVEKLSEKPVTTDHGPFVLHTYRDRVNGGVHFALVRGDITGDQVPLVRVQSTLSIRDLLGIRVSGTSGWDIQKCLARIAAEDRGVLVLLTRNESAADLLASVDAISGAKTSRDERLGGVNQTFLMIGVGSQILRMLGLRQFRIMGVPARYNAISGFDLEVVEFVGPK